MTRTQRLRIVVMVFWMSAGGRPASPAWAAQSAEGETQVTVQKTQEGLHFNVPPDWPIEKRNGTLGPIPIEEYLSRKFSAVESRVQELEKQTTGMDLRLRVMEEAMKGAQQRLRSTETAQ